MTAHETTPSDAGIYPSQDPIELGAYYMRHVEAMTALRLHDKADIAEQLAWRDREIDRLRAREIEQSRGALPELPEVTDAEVEAYVSAVNLHLGNMSAKDWELERFDPAKSISRVARIGLEAARKCRKKNQDGEACRRMGNRDE